MDDHDWYAADAVVDDTGGAQLRERIRDALAIDFESGNGFPRRQSLVEGERAVRRPFRPHACDVLDALAATRHQLRVSRERLEHERLGKPPAPLCPRRASNRK